MMVTERRVTKSLCAIDLLQELGNRWNKHNHWPKKSGDDFRNKFAPDNSAKKSAEPIRTFRGLLEEGRHANQSAPSRPLPLLRPDPLPNPPEPRPRHGPNPAPVVSVRSQACEKKKKTGRKTPLLNLCDRKKNSTNSSCYECRMLLWSRKSPSCLKL